MNELLGLKSLGLELPSLAYMMGSLFFGTVGYVAFRRGRKASRSELTWAGIVLMIYPYGVSQTWLLWLLGIVLCGWLHLKWD